jgi:Ni,Fe-hydrogenase III large subunit
VFELTDGTDVFLVAEATIEHDENSPSRSFPSVALALPSATLFEREIRDMFGLVPEGHPDSRPLVLHEDWPSDVFPLRKDMKLQTKTARSETRGYNFLKVDGEGVSEIPVGPVHAGIIEPGHFRFSTIGDAIINLETRLYYTHRGVEKLAESLRLDQVLLLSERISGDEAVANSTAYCQAIERVAWVTVPKRATQIRAVCAELERTYNHIGTIGGLSTDVGFAYGAARLNLLKERVMRLNEEISGSRLLFGVNRIGGVGIDLPPEKVELILRTIQRVKLDFDSVVEVLRNDSSVVDRLRGTGAIQYEYALNMGLVGVVARSSGIDTDTRKDHPYGFYRALAESPSDSPRRVIKHQLEMANRKGDVFARFDTRVHEVGDSIEMIAGILRDFDPKPELIAPVDRHTIPPNSEAIGYAESHRGETLHYVVTGDEDSLFRYKVRTASFVNWPAIEVAVLNDIVADFPLVNKSLDLSYAGNDL